MKKRILSIIIALSFVLAALPVAYAGETDGNNPEKTSFVFDDVQTKLAQFENGVPNKIKQFNDKGASNDHFRGYNYTKVGVYTPYQAALLAFSTSASALGADERVYLNLKIDGYPVSDKNNMAGGKVKIFYSSEGYPVKTELDKSVYVLSENKIEAGMNTFKFDITSMAKQALSDATAEDGVKTIKFIAEIDPDGTPVNQTGDKFIREDNEERQYIGGKIQYGANAPSLTVEEITPELTGIKINGEYLKDFESSKIDYTYNIAYSYQGIPTIEADTKYPELTYVVDAPTEIPDNATITVSTPGGKNRTYTIALGRAEVSPDLTDIKIDGESVEGFESSTEEYTHILAYNYNKEPEVSVVKKDNDATYDIIKPSQIPGYVTINVTTPDSKTKTYKVYLKRKEVSTKLSGIKVDGKSLANFSSSKKEYTYYVAENQGLPTVTPVKEDNNAEVVVIIPEKVPGTCDIEVSNYAGEITTYKVYLRYESSKNNPTIITTLPKVIYTNESGEEINTVPANGKVYATLDIKELVKEDNITFVTALYDDGFMIDRVSSEKKGNLSSLTNTLNVTLSDVSKAKIKSFIINDYNNGENILNCAELSSSNNNLKGLWFNNSLVEGFNKVKLGKYKITIPASVLDYPEFTFKTEDSGTKTEITYPVNFSGIADIKTTANNGDSKTYNVEFAKNAAEINNVKVLGEKIDCELYENIQNAKFSGTNEVLDECISGVKFFSDASHVVKSLDDNLIGGTLISFAGENVNPDKKSDITGYLNKTGYITFDINRSATVYVSWGKDPANTDKALPQWITSEGYEKVSNTAKNLVLTKDKASPMKYTYKKHFEVPEWSETPVTVSLGGYDVFTYWWIIVVFD